LTDLGSVVVEEKRNILTISSEVHLHSIMMFLLLLPQKSVYWLQSSLWLNPIAVMCVGVVYYYGYSFFIT